MKTLHPTFARTQSRVVNAALSVFIAFVFLQHSANTFFYVLGEERKNEANSVVSQIEDAKRRFIIQHPDTKRDLTLGDLVPAYLPSFPKLILTTASDYRVHAAHLRPTYLGSNREQLEPEIEID